LKEVDKGDDSPEWKGFAKASLVEHAVTNREGRLCQVDVSMQR
jgi:hypothetical protein